MGVTARGLLIGILLNLLSGQVICGNEALVSCVFLKSCLLPCAFQAADEEVIHWVLKDIPVHSYYYGEDHLDNQSVRFRARTSLFSDLIRSGNASLQLTNSTFADEGLYKCYTSTVKGHKESFIHLKVESPVQKVDIQVTGERITCSSGGIYPEPKLWWVTNTKGPIHNVTYSFPDHQGLYHINSSIPVMTNSTEVICSVSTTSLERKATLRWQDLVSCSSGDFVSIPCGASDSARERFKVAWTFNHTEPIVTYDITEPTHQVQEPWEAHVQDVSELGDLLLKGLSAQHEGIYTCELHNNRETFVSLTNLAVRSGQESYDGQKNTAVITVVSCVTVLVLVATGVAVYFCIKQGKINNKDKQNQQQNNLHQSKQTEEENEGLKN